MKILSLGSVNIVNNDVECLRRCCWNIETLEKNGETWFWQFKLSQIKVETPCHSHHYNLRRYKNWTTNINIQSSRQIKISGSSIEFIEYNCMLYYISHHNAHWHACSGHVDISHIILQYTSYQHACSGRRVDWTPWWGSNCGPFLWSRWSTNCPRAFSCPAISWRSTASPIAFADPGNKKCNFNSLFK